MLSEGTVREWCMCFEKQGLERWKLAKMRLNMVTRRTKTRCRHWKGFLQKQRLEPKGSVGY